MKRKRGVETRPGLAAYRRKRSADRTPEPFTAPSRARSRLFVVQKHAARSLHYDLRLEMEGVLQSWAVPKGPSLDPAVKRLAVRVEEHPLEYAEFEGSIPEGNYGAGAVIVWDRGRWDPIGDPVEGLRRGKLLFDLHGYKLRGRWTLFRTKGKETDWLLVKKPDGEAGAGREPPEESIRSGRTVEELRDGVDPAARIRRRLRRSNPPRSTPDPETIVPMLARTAEGPFTREGWVFEIKYDGYRLLGLKDGSRAALRYRRGRDVTGIYPEVARALAALPFERFVVDGELVVFDDEGRPSFRRLQQRVHLRRAEDLRRAEVETPATFFLFDLLVFDDADLRPLPLIERKELLRLLLPPVGPLRYCDHVEQRGEATFAAALEMGLEGIVAKRADAPYVAGRSEAWLKIRADRTGDFAIVGYTAPRGAREGFGALHLALSGPGGLVYAGRVGAGFDAARIRELHAALARERRPGPACSGPVPRGEAHTWVEPRRVCEVRYKEWTGEGLLRQPVFLRERDDKAVHECVAPERAAEPGNVPEAPAPRPEVGLTNLDKVFWPEEGYTKGELIDYYRSVSPWLLPYLRDRPLVLTRHPDGIAGKSFFQKDAPGFVPEWIRTERMWSEHAQREIRYFIADDEASLLYLINLGTIPLHLWSSRIGSLQHPDWCILDLDPKQAPFAHVVRIARTIRSLCEEIGLPSFVKTSGSSGLHVLLPLDGRWTFEQSRGFAEILARVVTAELPEIATIARSPSARGARVYVDYVQNGHGRLLAAPFCVRPLPGAPVSTPLRWREVRPSLDIRRFTLQSVPRRLRTMGEDPMRALLDAVPNLESALARLARRLEE